MAASDDKSPAPTPLSSSATAANEVYRTLFVATRLTGAELREVKSAASSAGKKVAEWLREAALIQARATQEDPTDPVLLAEIVGMRSLILNLFGKASQGPISSEDLQKMSAHADAIKDQKAGESLAERRRRTSAKSRVTRHETIAYSGCFLLNSRMAYVSISRGQFDAQIFTDSLEKLPKALGHDVSQQSVYKPERAIALPQPKIVTPKHDVELSLGFGLSL
jgi:hypothetical protein